MITARQGVPDQTDGQGAGTTADSSSVPWLQGQRPHDRDVTCEKPFLSRRQVDAFQSKHRNSG